MANKPPPEISSPDGDSINRLKAVPETEPDPTDEFDPANLRLDPDYLKSGGVKKLLTTVPVRKPNKQDFIRVHPDPDYRLGGVAMIEDRKSTRLNSSHMSISYAVFCLKKKKK